MLIFVSENGDYWVFSKRHSLSLIHCTAVAVESIGFLPPLNSTEMACSLKHFGFWRVLILKFFNFCSVFVFEMFYFLSRFSFWSDWIRETFWFLKHFNCQIILSETFQSSNLRLIELQRLKNFFTSGALIVLLELWKKFFFWHVEFSR